MAEVSPEQLLEQRWARLRTAVACGTPDRVPLSLVMDSFAAKTMGVPLSEFVKDVNLSGDCILRTMDKLGDVDSTQIACFAPAVSGMLWLSPMKMPGRELPEDSLWQMDEQERMTRRDYDDILEMGWNQWFGPYAAKYLREPMAAMQATMEATPHWAMESTKRGYAVFCGPAVNPPFENLCGGRTVKEFMLDLFKMPDKVEAVLDTMMDERREEIRGMVQACGPVGYWVGGWRSAPEFLSPRLWKRFVWAYMKELVKIVADAGGIPVLHYDANWDREIETLLELPAAKCVLALDGKTDIFRAKKILGGHMCILGDVSPSLLTLGTVEQVRDYCRRLLAEVGPDGFIMAQGCAIPPTAKFENVKAMVDSVQE
jgi:hypothetical protein